MEQKVSIRELIKAATSRMQDDFGLSKKKFGSSVDVGADRVNILKDFLTKYLPRYYGFGNGEITDAYGNQTGQVDIIICNEFHPYTYNAEGFGLFLVEGVDWAIEVKSNLTTELKEGMLQIKRIKGLKKEPTKGSMVFSSGSVLRRKQVSCILFGYDSPPIDKLSDKIKQLVSQLELSTEEIPDAIVSLNKGIVFNVFEGDPLKIEVNDVKRYGIIGAKLEEDTLFEMLAFLSTHAPHIIYQHPIILRYGANLNEVPLYFGQE
jgi:hypothetical protein